MEVRTNIKKARGLKDFTRLLIGFVFCLFGLSIYQQLSLYHGGVIDSPLNKTFYLLLLNHLGFASIVSFLLLIAFRFLEKSKPGVGFRVTLILFACLLAFEALLVEHFLQHYSLLLYANMTSGIAVVLSAEMVLKFCVLLLACGICYFLLYKLTWFLNPFIGKLFPFTIILFLLAMSTTVTEKRPINQNKGQCFISDIVHEALDFNEYEGREYPLLHKWEPNDALSKYFKLSDKRPNLVFIVIDGLSNEYLNGGKFQGFVPTLDSLSSKSLYWANFLANSNSKNDAVPNILGSLPHGGNGFVNLNTTVNRNTLFSILKSNGYRTSFYYGGNASLNNLDKFLNEEQVDVIMDKSKFGNEYILQNEDRAGVTLGYPDGELYKKWGASYYISDRPKAEFFLNLSTSRPFSVPNSEAYQTKVEKIVVEKGFSSKERRFISKNNDLFMSLKYADDALEGLLDMFRLTKEYDNTIFIITGSGKSYLPNDNELLTYRTPLMVYSPMLKMNQRFTKLASHHDIAPSILGLLDVNYSIKTPNEVSWIGSNLLSQEPNTIMLSSDSRGVQSLIKDDHVVFGRTINRVGDQLQLLTANSEINEKKLRDKLKISRAINEYVTDNNKIIPSGLALYKLGKREFTKEEMVWITSVFNGNNYDNAYDTARDLAHDGEYDKALLLSHYILDRVPGHIDAVILEGRIHAWKKRYGQSIAVLEKAIDNNPYYHDAYAALLDVYYWSGNNAKASWLYERIQENNVETVELVKKVERCMSQIEKIDEIKKASMAKIQFEDQ